MTKIMMMMIVTMKMMMMMIILMMIAMMMILCFKVTEADDEDYDSVDSSEASDPGSGGGQEVTHQRSRGHELTQTEDSGIDSITVSPSREGAGVMETLLNMGLTAGDNDDDDDDNDNDDDDELRAPK